MRVGTWIRRFVIDELDSNRKLHDAIEAFTEALVVGNMKAGKEQILTDQEQARRGLATASERQYREDTHNRHPDPTGGDQYQPKGAL